jgi:cytochrome P450
VASTGAMIAADELLGRAAIEDPYPLFARLRREAPVARLDGADVWLVSTWDLVEQAVGRNEDFSANLTGMLYTQPDGTPGIFELGRVQASAGAVIATADDPAHARHREIVQPGMSAAAIAALEQPLRGWLRERTAPLVHAGQGDYVGAVAEPVPTLAMASLIDLPESDCKLLQLWAMTGGDMLAGTTTPDRMAELGAQTGAMAVYLRDRVRSGSESRGLRGALARAVAAGALELETAVGIAIVLVGAGGESTASLLGSAVRLLACDMALQDRLRGNPGLVPRFVEEVIRLESPFRFHYRVARRDCELAGVRLAEGSRLMLCWASANRDAAAFPNADAIDLERRFPKRHLGFGRGIHFCLGAPLARLEARLAVEELLFRTRRFELDPGRAPRHVPSLFVRRLERLDLRLEAS